ncbi:hypothetical protein Pedsa_0271 [Pseudopedobacter saltans DSM 12145]|uniref:DUF3311 domain-containing protein n=1 Tax=Pseudopedobacter saltans (strain ATCC 51119 / DSM 12145 / JCM 21818 / CCUG 39354 / LMG 10337 / NBRC 100064 / NCIMB 13643) TaxID=762903 RepID=F0SEJ1_PSESL|nr:hypothetical protein Pedsa_0271 [Pseudopedobacter saltans DSM 12145]
MKERLNKERLVFVSIIFSVLLTFPVLSISNRSIFIGGIPLLYIYLFGVWLLLIIALFLFSKRY